MEKLLSPFVRFWNHVEIHYGFAGQVFFSLLIILLVLGVIWFVGNRGR